MALNSTQYPNVSRVVSGAAILSPNDGILLCNTSTAPVTMTLLEIPANYWQTTWRLYVLDNSNNAGTNNITISVPSGYTINNASTLVINTNGGGVVITIASNTSFFGQVSPLPVGGGGVISITASAPLTGGTITSSGSIGIPAADVSTDGYLTQSSFNTFAAKGDPISIYEGGSLRVTNTNLIDFGKGYFDVTNPSGASTSVKTLDSGWVDLDGFAWIEAAYRPKCRRLGSAIYFKGNAVVPMRDPVTPANLYQPYGVATEFYEKVFESNTYIGTDAGGCDIDVNGAIKFNQDNSVLPTSVFNPLNGDVIDSSYYTGWKPAYRRYYADTVVPPVAFDHEVSVTAIINAYITTNGVLRAATIFDIENGIAGVGAGGLIGSSTFRMMTPSIVQGDFIPNYIARNNTTGENAQVSSMQRYLANTATFSTATGGVLTVLSVPSNTYIEVGQTIYTATFPANTYIEQQLTGVSGGAGTYQISSSFTYAGASSVLLLNPSNNATMQTGITPYNAAYGTIGAVPYKYPFDMDGSKPSELGGMIIDLSGLVVFLQPI